MYKKVSVIMPNYNAEKYISRCINSVLNQKYENIELIIVDDGSNDESCRIIERYSKEHENIRTIYQQNLNAAIARNRGIEHATGEYLIFLDSDDILYPNAIKKMVSKIEEDNSDLVIGNFNLIDQYDNTINDCIFTDYDKVEENAITLNGLTPNPSNKLYRASIISKYGIVFGNVRIGQDLNFYLKYLLKCKRVSLVNDFIYGWRTLSESISNKVSFRIFDITESFKDTRNFYIKENKQDVYDSYIKMVEYRHYYLQMEKQVKFPDRKSRKLVVDYFKYHLNNIDVKSCLNFKENISDYRKCILKMRFAPLYKSLLYKKILKIYKG